MLTIPGNIIPGESSRFGGLLPPTVSGVSIPTTIVVGTPISVSYTLGGGPAVVVTRAWYRGATLIASSTTSDSYTPVQADAGNTSNIFCRVIPVNAAGSASADSNTVAQVLDAAANTYIVNSGNTLFRSEINQFVLDLKSNNLWTKMNRIYPFLGGTASSCAVDLVTGTSGTFSGTFTYSASGPLPNGVNAFFNTGLNATSLTANNNHLSFDSFTNNAIAIDFDIGVGTSATSGTDFFDLYLRRNNSTNGFDAGTFPNGRVSSTTTDSAAYFVGSIVANNDRKLFRNGLQLNVSTTKFSQTFPNGNIFIFAINGLEIPGAGYFGSKGCKLSTIGSGLTAAEVSTLQTIRITFQTAVGR